MARLVLFFLLAAPISAHAQAKDAAGAAAIAHHSAKVLFEKGDLEGAVPFYRRAIELDPSASSPTLNWASPFDFQLGDANLNLGRCNCWQHSARSCASITANTRWRIELELPRQCAVQHAGMSRLYSGAVLSPRD